MHIGIPAVDILNITHGGAAAMRPLATLNIALVSVIVVADIIVTAYITGLLKSFGQTNVILKHSVTAKTVGLLSGME